jgi:phosphoribosylaminoimidazolecarboxamide formyltransferase/IMP cyclohydrolase
MPGDASDRVAVRRALLSVSDKEGLAELGRGLAKAGVALISTGSTAEVLRDAGLQVTEVAEVTGVPEMMDGRVKTLHPAIHAGILADRSVPGHLEELAARGFEPFDLVVANLYPFERTVASGAGERAVVEQIDIGGPTLVRAAAKNFASVTVAVSPGRYEDVLAEIREHGGVPGGLRAALAAEAFAHVAAYDAAIAAWFRPRLRGALGPELSVGLRRVATLRYGENPHQAAALYGTDLSPGPLGGAQVLQGKEMSFNNWLDADAARSLASSLVAPATVIVKHNNPCGAAVAGTGADAYRAALTSDPVSAFGGVVAFNHEVDEAAAEAMAEVFTEVVVAPGYSEAALARFGAKQNLRVLRSPNVDVADALDIRPIQDGALVQEADMVGETRADMKVVSRRAPDEDEWEDLLFAWTVAARVKSNAIVLAGSRATVGVGAGQMSRVDSVDIAARKAGDRARGSVMASDAFFPFRDGIDRAAEAGVRAVIQPGGSVRDQEVVGAADEHGMAMVLTDRRHFRH